ncbi:MAG: adenine deaminase [Bacteroidales bacterium]|nr:adenine deaminase [Bacteroidales bacterium]MCF8386586.1 adenine deaminase [Bacteroidales bacterium]MCF8398132.1 adenine deaminase [Bacteroidales bacterium]
MKDSHTVSGKIVDIVNREIFEGSLLIKDGKISQVSREKNNNDQYILPGLIDAHIHIESSMLIPSEFARLASVHGTVATVSDPHEIANVLGIDGINYMIENGRKVPMKFYFGASSCVPATPFETAGAELGVDELDHLLQKDEINYLSEMMNWPGVLFGDKLVQEKLDLAKKYGKPIDGHAPGVKGDDARKYANAGITTDHECFSKEEALDKIRAGMKILIREGSAAKNFNALIGLLKEYPESMMFCSDDKHPNDLVEGHINQLVKRAIKMGFDMFDVLRAAVLNPIQHYNLEVGMLRENDPADFIIVDNLKDFVIQQTWINGEKIAENGKTRIQSVEELTPNKFAAEIISPADLKVPPQSNTIRVMEALDGELITNEEDLKPKVENDNLVSDTEKDILKIVVQNRYEKAKPAVAFVKNFGLKRGAIASTVAHDSHNIVAVGVTDKEIAEAINVLVDVKGGVSLSDDGKHFVLPLPVAGLMSNKDGFEVARKYDDLDRKAKELGSKLNAPYMTLSFMALLVIPNLKLSDKGLFDGKKFEFTSLFGN